MTPEAPEWLLENSKRLDDRTYCLGSNGLRKPPEAIEHCIQQYIDDIRYLESL